MKPNAHQKLGLAVFIVIGFATLAFGAVHMSKAITGPFQKKDVPAYLTFAEAADENMRRLKEIDSDGDGLSDYDELYIYRTSPYLEDSDSDGISDYDEIMRGTDPNCPQGRTCREASIEQQLAAAQQQQQQTGSAPSGQGATGSVPTADAITAAIVETFGDVQSLTPERIAAEIARMSGADLRAFLVRLGIPEQQLRQLDDATLRSAVHDVMSDLVTATQPSAP